MRRLSEYLASGKTGFSPRQREAAGDDAAAAQGGAIGEGEGEGVDGVATRRRRSSATLEMIDFIKKLGITVKNEAEMPSLSA